MKEKYLLPLLILSIISCASIPDRRNHDLPDLKNSNFGGLQFGLCHAGYTKGVREYEQLHKMGVKWVRIDFHWETMEKERGIWDFSKFDKYMEAAEREGMKVLAILDYNPSWLHLDGGNERGVRQDELPLYLNYVKAVANRYGDRVGAFEIWNEPNTSRFWEESDKEFFQLTRSTLDLLKSIVPQTPVAIGALFYHPIVGASSYLKRMIKAGLLQKADALSIHPYALNEKYLENRAREARTIIADAGLDTPLWITEAGFPTGGNYPNKVSLDEHGKTIARALTRLAASGAELVIWFTLFDSSSEADVLPNYTSEEFFGLVWPDDQVDLKVSANKLISDQEQNGSNWLPYREKPGALPFTILSNLLNNGRFHNVPIEIFCKDRKKIYEASFTLQDGEIVTILWDLKRGQTVLFPQANKSISVQNLVDGKVRELEPEESLFVGKEPLLVRFF